MDTWIHKLYQDCAADLFRIARHRLQDEQLAQDIVQEVFLLLLERKKELKHHPNHKGWLIKTMDYKILHALEKQARENLRSEERRVGFRPGSAHFWTYTKPPVLKAPWTSFFPPSCPQRKSVS